MKRRSVASLVASLTLAVAIGGCGASSPAAKTTTTTRSSSLVLDLKGGVQLHLTCRRPASNACRTEAARLRKAEAAARAGG